MILCARALRSPVHGFREGLHNAGVEPLARSRQNLLFGLPTNWEQNRARTAPGGQALKEPLWEENPVR